MRMDATGRRPPPIFVGDHPALDFLNTYAIPSGGPVDWIDDGPGLVDWLERARLLARGDVARFRSRDALGALEAVAWRARDLREWFRGFVARHAGASLPTSASGELKPLNFLLSGDDLFRQVEPATPDEGGSALLLVDRRRWRGPETILLPIAEAVADLICTADFTLVRKCESSACVLWFYDRTKGHARRWCRMAVCGNRAKAAAHRARQRGRTSDPA
jgi:predicted RNA-binding Zn ribbon-like protein